MMNRGQTHGSDPVACFKRPTSIHYIPPGGGTANHSWPYTMISLLFGWWGFPWGFIYTPMALATNFKGGKDVTAEVMASITPQPQAAPEAPSPAV
jgi:hypothetical protein